MESMGMLVETIAATRKICNKSCNTFRVINLKSQERPRIKEKGRVDKITSPGSQRNEKRMKPRKEGSEKKMSILRRSTMRGLMPVYQKSLMK